MNKKTLFFSNIIGNVMIDDSSVRFNDYMSEYLIKNHKDLVIGFCAGAINLSKYSIITSDEDFDKPDSYYGIGRENICIEPHYNDINDIVRNNELRDFSKKYNTKIYCIPDESIIYFKDEEKFENGKIYMI